jgi:uncharacterized protein YdaU (DUF1376 family)
MGENGRAFREAGRERVGSTTHDPDQSPNTEVNVAPAKSTKAPAFQFFPRDFLSSPKVDRMAMPERGAYITLLCRCWLDNGLPTDLTELAHFCRMKPAQFDRMWKSGKIRECFHERGGKLHNERLDAERRKQTSYRQRQSDNAKAGWQSRGNATALPDIDQQHASGNARAHARPADEDADSKLQIPSSVLEEKKRSPEIDGQKAFMAFQAAYPENRRKGGYLVQQQFLAAVENAGGSARLMAALANHIASEQWSNPKHIPGMDTWLNEERWRQELPARGSESDTDDRRLPAWARS